MSLVRYGWDTPEGQNLVCISRFRRFPIGSRRDSRRWISKSNSMKNYAKGKPSIILECSKKVSLIKIHLRQPERDHRVIVPINAATRHPSESCLSASASANVRDTCHGMREQSEPACTVRKLRAKQKTVLMALASC